MEPEQIQKLHDFSFLDNSEIGSFALYLVNMAEELHYNPLESAELFKAAVEAEATKMLKWYEDRAYITKETEIIESQVDTLVWMDEE